MLEEHGYAAGCLKCSRVREQRPAAGTRHWEERRARFEALLRASGDASVARADARANEHLARRVQEGAEAAAAALTSPAGSSSSSAA
eukprot:404673-Alexandrium_andersonii.AAC.1